MSAATIDGDRLHLHLLAETLRSAKLGQHDAAAMRVLDRFCQEEGVAFPPRRVTHWVEFYHWARTRPTRYIIASNGSRRRSAAMSDTTLVAILKRIDRVLSAHGIESFARDERLVSLKKRLAARHRVARRVRRALMPADLRKVVRACDRSTLRGKRLLAALLLLWAMAGRISELIRLVVGDLEFVDGYGLIVRIGVSKMNATPYPEYVRVPFADDPELCAVRAVRRWLTTAKITDGPLFPQLSRSKPCTLTTRVVSSTAFWRLFNTAFVLAGIDPSGLGTHCCRRGNLTVRAKQNQPLTELREHARQKGHKALFDYIMPTELGSAQLDKVALT